MKNKDIINYAQESLLKAGAQKAKCILTKKEKNELNVASGEISLFRTPFDTNLSLTAIIDDKKGTISLKRDLRIFGFSGRNLDMGSRSRSGDTLLFFKLKKFSNKT